MMKKNSAGFTLIEVLVTVTIIALLTAISVVSYASVNRSSRDSKRLSDAQQIRAALEAYRADNVNHQYPSTLIALVGSYLSSVPQDPKSPTYNYSYSSSGTNYILTIYSEKEAIYLHFNSLGQY
jgi:prepilin-type N-terminal cleavage/methylation domain-containing protein